MSESTRDFFAQIAAHGSEAPPQLAAPEPRTFASVPVLTCRPGGPRRPIPPAPSGAADLAQALADLRRQLRPFHPTRRHRPATKGVQPLTRFQWRLETATDRRDLAPALAGKGGWKTVRLPHYGGPIGRAAALYRTEVRLAAGTLAGRAVFLRFAAADYIATVYVNGTCVGQHEGFFAPFEFEIGSVLRPGRNTVLVRVQNDAICMSNKTWGQPLEGDKLYAATGLGWDEPGIGWHHCPPGMGLCGPVTLESRPRVHLQEVWVRPLPSLDAFELHAEVANTRGEEATITLTHEVRGWNFALPALRGHFAPAVAGPGLNRYVAIVKLPDARQWSPETPWLYAARVSLRHGGDRDRRATTFGMRTFVIDETAQPKGRLLLNGVPTRLRGANTMGFEQQCVAQGRWKDLDQMLLLAKAAGLNFLRFTQRPVPREIYARCDALGIMTQTDLPLFAYLRFNQVTEALRQAAEMERHIRSHASAVMVSLINEPFPLAWANRLHRHVSRAELEVFLAAATQVIRLVNPDRQVKPIDGDYDAPGPGLPDNHVYCGWYNGHGLDLGKLHRGHWVPVKPGWLYACGEFGAEGLDPVDLMRRRYPAGWRRGWTTGTWSPAAIPHAQTGNLHGLWMDAARTPEAWVRSSQAHQAWVTQLMTEAFRRDPRMVSFAIHLLVDAFPAGWMKALVDCELRPKPAYFAYRNALRPVAALLRSDRSQWWAGEDLTVEAWLANDTHRDFFGQLAYQLVVDGGPAAGGEAPAVARADSSTIAGMVRVRAPHVAQRRRGHVELALRDAAGTIVSQTRLPVEIFPRADIPTARVHTPRRTGIAAGLLEQLQVRRSPARTAECLLVDNAQDAQDALEWTRAGGTLVVLDLAPGRHRFGTAAVEVAACGFGARHFVSRDTGHPLVRDFQPNDFRFWHSTAADRADALLRKLFFAPDWTPILTTPQIDWGQSLRPALAAAERNLGRGRIVVCLLELHHRVATNPTAAEFARRLLRHRGPETPTRTSLRPEAGAAG